MKTIKETISSNIKRIRGKRFTQDELCEIAGIPKSTYVFIEGGKGWPEYANIQAIAGALGVPEIELFQDPTGTCTPTPEQVLIFLRGALNDPGVFEALKIALSTYTPKK